MTDCRVYKFLHAILHCIPQFQYPFTTRSYPHASLRYILPTNHLLSEIFDHQNREEGVRLLWTCGLQLSIHPGPISNASKAFAALGGATLLINQCCSVQHVPIFWSFLLKLVSTSGRVTHVLMNSQSPSKYVDHECPILNLLVREL